MAARDPNRLDAAASSVYVSVLRGVVTLPGLTSSPRARDRVGDTGATARDVRAVESHLPLAEA